jgi:hypothetical protein
MLPPFIIEQIRQREEQEKRSEEQPRLELPLDDMPPMRPRVEPDAEIDVPRGVVIFEL